MLLLRKIVRGDVETAVIGFRHVVDPGDDSVPPLLTRLRFSAIGDLNGDGTMEIATTWQFYEGSGQEVFEYVDDDLGPVLVLEGGCGA